MYDTVAFTVLVLSLFFFCLLFQIVVVFVVVVDGSPQDSKFMNDVCGYKARSNEQYYTIYNLTHTHRAHGQMNDREEQKETEESKQEEIRK